MLRGIVYSLLSALCFSTLIIIAKFGFDSGMSSAQMLFYRFAFGALTTAAFLISTGKKSAFIIERRTLVKIVLIGGTMFLPQSFFFILSIKYIPVVTAELVLYFYPTAVVLISWLVLKKSLNRLHLIAAAVAFAGSALILFEAFSSNMSLTGLLLAMMAMLTFSSYMLITHNILEKTDPFALSFYLMATASVILSFGLPEGSFSLTPYKLSLALMLGIIPSFLATIFLYKALKEIGSSMTSIASSIEPALTVILAHIFLGEKTAAMQIIGMIMIMLGIILPMWGSLFIKRKAVTQV